MISRPRTIAVLLALLSTPCAVTGCRGLEPEAGQLFTRGTRQVIRKADDATDEQPEQALHTSASAAATSAPAGTALATVLDDLQQLARSDPAAHQRLTDQLKTAPPEQWPLVVEQFQATLALREQLAEISSSEKSPPVKAVAHAANNSSTPAAPETNVKESIDGVTAAAKEAFSPLGGLVDPRAVRSELVADETFADRSPANLSMPGIEEPAPREPHQLASLDAPTDRGAVLASYPAKGTSTAADGVIRASYEQPREKSSPDWRGRVREAALALSDQTAEHPQTTQEVYDQVRLRLLELAAGRTDEAVKPIPGISPSEQDYWSKQLFALATYMDASQQPDDKRRAAAAVMQLEDALSNLRNIGTLSVRNLAFCSNVVDFGVYTPTTSNTFAPGEHVTLYAEVENFRTIDAESMYHTSLASSYKVLDQNGQRVDGGQFPDVDDECRRHRRDFHIQYGFALPTRIYPGRYQLQLVVKDNQSDKIGQSTIDFEIKDDRR